MLHLNKYYKNETSTKENMIDKNKISDDSFVKILPEKEIDSAKIDHIINQIKFKQDNNFNLMIL